MFRYIFELLIALFFFGILRSVVSGIARTLSTGGSVPNPVYRPQDSSPEPTMRSAGQLHKDPVCGMYIAANTPYTEINAGQTLYFCSSACRDNYRQQNRSGSRWPKSTAARS